MNGLIGNILISIIVVCASLSIQASEEPLEDGRLSRDERQQIINSTLVELQVKQRISANDNNSLTTITVHQGGSDNNIDISTNGEGNQLSIVQDGVSNNIDLYQYGLYSQVLIEQIGINQEIHMLQVGQGNVIQAWQHGSNNIILYEGVGNSIRHSIRQSGNDMTTIIREYK